MVSGRERVTLYRKKDHVLEGERIGGKNFERTEPRTGKEKSWRRRGGSKDGKRISLSSSKGGPGFDARRLETRDDSGLGRHRLRFFLRCTFTSGGATGTKGKGLSGRGRGG